MVAESRPSAGLVSREIDSVGPLGTPPERSSPMSRARVDRAVVEVTPAPPGVVGEVRRMIRAGPHGRASPSSARGRARPLLAASNRSRCLLVGPCGHLVLMAPPCSLVRPRCNASLDPAMRRGEHVRVSRRWRITRRLPVRPRLDIVFPGPHRARRHRSSAPPTSPTDVAGGRAAAAAFRSAQVPNRSSSSPISPCRMRHRSEGPWGRARSRGANHRASSRGVGSDPHAPNLGAGQGGAPHESTDPTAPEGTGNEKSKPLEREREKEKGA